MAGTILVPFVPVREAVVDRLRMMTREWQHWARSVTGVMQTLQSYRGVLVGTLAEQPTGLGPSHAGLLYMVTDLGHECRWNGTAWEFAPGDEGNGFFRDFAVAPQMSGWWQVCDGSATTRLVVGGITLTTAAFTTPNLSDAYRKAGAYTGSVLGAAAPGAVVSGFTDYADLTHAHGPGTYATGGPSAGAEVQVGSGQTVASDSHDHDVVAGQSGETGLIHLHAAGTLAVSVDATGQPKRIACPVYFRR